MEVRPERLQRQVLLAGPQIEIQQDPDQRPIGQGDDRGHPGGVVAPMGQPDKRPSSAEVTSGLTLRLGLRTGLSLARSEA